MALKLKGSTSGFVAIDAPSVAGNNTLILPENTGSAHQILANDITAGVTTFTQITVSRNGDLTVPGTISIGGTLTYEDVTSVDSVGIVTARGLSIFGNTTGLNATGISTFGDDVNIADKIVHTGDTNTTIRFPGNDQIQLETSGHDRLYIASDGDIGFGTVTPAVAIHHYADGNNGNSLRLENREGYITITNDADVLSVDATQHHFRNKAGSAHLAKFISGGSVELYHNGTMKAQTLSDGFAVSGDSTLYIGAAGDLRLLHNGTNSHIWSQTGELDIRSDDFHLRNSANNEDMITADANGGVNLYHNNIKKVETFANGMIVYGPESGGGLVNIYADEGDDNADKWRLHANPNGSFYLQNYTSGSWESNIAATGNGKCALYHDDVVSVETTADGLKIQKTASGIKANLKIEATNGGQAGLELVTSLSGTNRAARIDMYNQNTLQWTIINDYQQNGTNDFSVRHGAEEAIRALPDGKVSLYYDDTERFFTTTGGAQVTGSLQLTEHLLLNNGKELKLGNSSQMTIWHSGSDFTMYNNTGQLVISNASGTGVGEGEIVFKTGSNSTRWRMLSGGDFIPASNNSFTVGSSSNRVAVFYSNAALNTSDKTLKNTITTSDLGLDFINKLKPVSYKWNQKEGEISDTKTHYGLIAQDVEEVITSSGKTLNDFGGVDKPDEGQMSLAYSELISPLIKAVQELSSKVAALETA